MICFFHKWKVESKDILPSIIEQLGRGDLEGRGDMGNKPCIVHYKCDKCGTEKVERI